MISEAQQKAKKLRDSAETIWKTADGRGPFGGWKRNRKAEERGKKREKEALI